MGRFGWSGWVDCRFVGCGLVGGRAYVGLVGGGWLGGLLIG